MTTFTETHDKAKGETVSKASTAKKPQYDISLDEAYQILRTGPFSILSEKALAGLIVMFQRVHSAGYTSGHNQGSTAGRKARA